MSPRSSTMSAKLSALGREERRKSHLHYGSTLTRIHLSAMRDKFGPFLSLFLQACGGLIIVSVSELLVALYWNASQRTKQPGCARCLWPCRGERASDLQTPVETEFTSIWWLTNHNASHRWFSLPVTVLLRLFRHCEPCNTLSLITALVMPGRE